MLGLGRRRHERELADALAASMDAVQSGVASVDESLQRYPRLASELEPLLRTSARVRTVLRTEPSEAARLRARAAFLSAAVQQRETHVTPHPLVRRRAWVAFAPAAIAAALFAAIAVPVVGSMDSGSTPGDWNYGFKRATERVRLALTTDSTDRRSLRLEFAKRRLDEIERLSTTGHINQHAAQVTVLLHEYTSDIQQVNSALQSVPALPDSAKQQIDAVTQHADAVVTTVQSAAPTDQSVQDAAQQAQVETAQTKAKALSVTPSKPAAAATRTTVPTQTQAPPSDTPTATATPDVTNTATATSTSVTATPSATATTGPTATPTPATASATPSPSATQLVRDVTQVPQPSATARPVETLPATVSTPVRPAAATAAPTDTAAPEGTLPPRTAAAALGTEIARTPTPVPTTPTPAPTTPAPARAAAGTSSLTMISTGPNGTSYRYQGPPVTLDSILPLPAGQVAVVWYAEQNGVTRGWYPGTPAPTIAGGATFTVVQRTTPAR